MGCEAWQTITPRQGSVRFDPVCRGSFLRGGAFAMTDREFNRIVREAWDEYKGSVRFFEGAVGALVLGRLTGWQAVRLTRAHGVYKRSEDILGVRFRDVLPDRLEGSEDIRAMQVADKLGEWWRAFKRDEFRPQKYARKI